ncbi:fimbria/pilus outer membrane usher protein [Enterobacteriaceae bacterium H16N7]|nr:fimbria/pilus outer membrane usher protein [Dryocola clanedunensis]
MKIPHPVHREKWPTRSALSLALATAFTLSASAAADEVQNRSDDIEFDIQAMQARGIDPKLAQAFKQAPRFMTGTTQVTLTVNGSGKGRVAARFNEQGQLCVDAPFIKAAGLVKPAGFDAKAPCFDLKSAWPQTELNLDPGEVRVDLVVPPQYVADTSASSGNWIHGGAAAMLNYDAQYMDSAGSSSGTNFMQLNSEGGFNVHDWIVRSRQNFSRLNGKDTFQYQSAYAQRSFDGIKKVLQAGQINLANSMFGTGQVLGAQLFPETALTNTRKGAGLVDGIADTQSVVEVRQSGVLLYSTTVPAGPFHLQGFSLLNSRTDLAVTLTGNNGDIRQFTVPAASFALNGPATVPGLSFGVGKLDQDGSDESPLLGTVATGWLLTPTTSLNAGLLGSSLYNAGAANLNAQPFNSTSLSIQTTVAQDSKHNDSGVSVDTSLSHNLIERLSLSLNMSQNTSGYRELNDAVQDDNQDTSGRTHNQYGAGINWSHEWLGNFSFSWARSSTFDNESTTYLRGGWSRQFGSAYLGLSVDHDSGTAGNKGDDRIYLSLSIPLGNGNISSYMNNAHNGTRAGTRFSQRSSQDRGYSLSADRDYRSNKNSYTGSMDMVTPVSQLSGSVSQDSDNFTNWSARASGSLVAHAHGVTLSPYQVSDTFAVAKVGDDAGVRIDTPSGPTWTDFRGYAVLPSLRGYQKSSVQVDTRSLGKNVDISNALQETELARGAVSYVNFDIIHTRRVLATVLDATGKPVPHGASVFDDKDNFVTVVGDKGQVFLPDTWPGMKLDVQASGQTLCAFTLKLPETQEVQELYETYDAVCR